MNPIQSKIEQVFKEYLDYKRAFEKKEKEYNERIPSIIEKANSMTPDKAQEFYFKESVDFKLLNTDFYQSKVRLYYFIKAYKDLIEIPDNILKELNDFEISFAFAVRGDEITLLDESIKETYLDKYNNILKNTYAR